MISVQLFMVELREGGFFCIHTFDFDDEDENEDDYDLIATSSSLNSSSALTRSTVNLAATLPSITR